jgi:hypothetical protein
VGRPRGLGEAHRLRLSGDSPHGLGRPDPRQGISEWVANPLAIPTFRCRCRFLAVGGGTVTRKADIGMSLEEIAEESWLLVRFTSSNMTALNFRSRAAAVGVTVRSYWLLSRLAHRQQAQRARCIFRQARVRTLDSYFTQALGISLVRRTHASDLSILAPNLDSH